MLLVYNVCNMYIFIFSHVKIEGWIRVKKSRRDAFDLEISGYLLKLQSKGETECER